MMPDLTPRNETLSEEVVHLLSGALESHAKGDSSALRTTLEHACAEAHARSLPAETMVLSMRKAWSRVMRPRWLIEEDWSRSYYTALSECLDVFFAGR